jgi:hypothetical protein
MMKIADVVVFEFVSEPPVEVFINFPPHPAKPGLNVLGFIAGEEVVPVQIIVGACRDEKPLAPEGL